MQKRINGFIWNAAGSIAYGANSVVMLALVSRYGTVTQIGQFGIAFTTAQILYFIGLFGASHWQMTDYEERYSFQTYKRLRIFSCLLMLIGCAVAIVGLGFEREKAVYTVVLTILMLLNAVGELYQSLFFQKNRLDLSGSALFYRTLGSLVVFCIALILWNSILLAVTAQTISNLLITLYYIKCVAPTMLCNNRLDTPNVVWDLFQECLPLFGGLLLINVVINTSKYGVELLMDDVAQGYYNMLFMPAQVINLCSQFLYKPYLNQYSLLLKEKRNKEFCILIFRQLGCIVVLTIVCCAGAWVLGIPVLSIFYGQDLTGFAGVLIVVVLGGGIFAACQLCYYILVILRKQTTILAIYVGATACAAALSYVLVKHFSLAGAACSFCAVHITVLIAYFVVIMKSLAKRERG